MTSDSYQPCALVPVYNHGSTTGAVVKALQATGLYVILVDDGSNEETKLILEALSSEDDFCELVQLKKNSGKGSAVIAGLLRAKEKGYTHALQVDADGQHELSRASVFLEDSRTHPGSLIAGAPVYNESAPSSRLAGRKITNFWVSIETLSSDIVDAMIGFRVYPIRRTLRALRAIHVSKRMGFDIEVIVRLHWLGVPLRFHPVGIDYPAGGTSNFRMVRDNIGISAVHTKLFFGMVFRLPILLLRKLFGL